MGCGCFLALLFVLLTCMLGLVWYAVKQLKPHRTTTSRPPLGPSVRQAGLVSLILVLLLSFNAFGILHFWNIVPLTIAAVLIEFFFQAEKRPHATLSYDKDVE
jgi:uncharacterized metal-binding protein